MTATSTAASSLPPVRTAYHVPLSLMASISEETISLWLKLGALEKLEQAVLDGYGDQLCGKTSRIPQVNKFLRQVPLFQNKIKDIHKAVSDGKLRDVQHLIDRKKLAFCRDASGATPLHKAVIFGHQDIIEYLVDRYGGVIHVRDHQGRTPLHYAAFLPDGGEVYQFLLSAGADERAMDIFGRQSSYYVDGQNENTLEQIRDSFSINGIKKIKPKYYIQSNDPKPTGSISRPTLSKIQVRELISEGNIDSLEELVLQGCGDRLLGETSKDPKMQSFLNIVPLYLERINDLHRAVLRDQLEHVIILLENRRLAMARDQLGATPLHKAVWFGHYKIAHYISHHFMEAINTLDLEGRTPLHYAAALRDNKHMYGILIEAGTNKAILDNKGKPADYYLQYPEHLNLDEIIKRCHKVNANYLATTTSRIKGKSPIRQTPPPSNGNSSSPRSDDNDSSCKESTSGIENGRDPDQILAMLQKDNLAKRLDMTSANIRRWVQERDVEKLERAVMEGYGEKVVRLQGPEEEREEEEGKGEGEKKEIEETAMDNDEGAADPKKGVEEMEDEQGEEMADELTGKMTQMVERIHAIHTAVSNDDLMELQSQLNEKDYALAKDHMGMTPLHRAVFLGRTNILKFLIEKFPETINAKNKEGRTPLHYAASMSRKDGQNLYKLLLQAGADTKIRDNNGRTPDFYKTHLMTTNNKVLTKSKTVSHVLPRHSEPLNRYSKQGVLERMTTALQRGDVDLLQELALEGHGRHLLGKTSWNDDVKQFLKGLPNYLSSIVSIHDSVKKGDLDSIKNLLNKNDKLLRARDEAGATPVHSAASQGQLDILQFLIRNYPSVLNCKDASGRTALHIVSQMGNQELCKILKDAGADQKILDQKGRTPDFYLQHARFGSQVMNNGIADSGTLALSNIEKNPRNFVKTNNAKYNPLVNNKNTRNIKKDLSTEALKVKNPEDSKLHSMESEPKECNKSTPDEKDEINHAEPLSEQEDRRASENGESATKEKTENQEVKQEEPGTSSAESIEANEEKPDEERREVSPKVQMEGKEKYTIEDDMSVNTDLLVVEEKTHDDEDAEIEQPESKADDEHKDVENDEHKRENDEDAEERVEQASEDNSGDSSLMVKNDENAEKEKSVHDAEPFYEESLEAGKTPDETEDETASKDQENENREKNEENEKEENDEKVENAQEEFLEENKHSEDRKENDDEDVMEEKDESVSKADDKSEDGVIEEISNTKRRESKQIVADVGGGNLEPTEGEETNEEEDANAEKSLANPVEENDVENEADSNNMIGEKASEESCTEEKEENEGPETVDSKEERKDDYESLKESGDASANDENEGDRANDENNAIEGAESNEDGKTNEVDKTEEEFKADEDGETGDGEKTNNDDDVPDSDKIAENSETQEDNKVNENTEVRKDENSEAHEASNAISKTDDINATENKTQEINEDDSAGQEVQLSAEGGEIEESKGEVDSAANDAEVEKENALEDGTDKHDDDFKDDKNETPPSQTKDHLDELIELWIKEGDLLRLEHVVLAGQGDRLIERTSDDKQVQDFLDLVPIYMAKIRAVHEAVVKGQLREVRSVLTRKRFALSRDHVGASPLHLAVLHGHVDVSTYIISHFPETMDGPDNEGRTPFHYASVLKDEGALYRILKAAGADEHVEDKSGHSPKYYLNHPGELTTEILLEPYTTAEDH